MKQSERCDSAKAHEEKAFLASGSAGTIGGLTTSSGVLWFRLWMVEAEEASRGSWGPVNKPGKKQVRTISHSLPNRG